MKTNQLLITAYCSSDLPASLFLMNFDSFLLQVTQFDKSINPFLLVFLRLDNCLQYFLYNWHNRFPMFLYSIFHSIFRIFHFIFHLIVSFISLHLSSQFLFLLQNLQYIQEHQLMKQMQKMKHNRWQQKENVQSNLKPYSLFMLFKH